MQKEAKNNETTKVELGYTTPSAQTNKVKQTSTNRTDTSRLAMKQTNASQTDPNQPAAKRTSTNQTARKRTDPGRTELFVDGDNETKRIDDTKRGTNKRSVTGHRIDSGTGELQHTGFGWDGIDRSGATCGAATVSGGIHQSARQMIEHNEAIAAGQKQAQNPCTQFTLAVNEGPTADMLAASMEIFNMPKIDLDDEDAVRQRLNDFFEVYAKRGLRPTVAGMGLALGLDRRRLWEIKVDATNTRQRNWAKGTRDLIKGAYVIMESLWESYMVGGKLNPVTGIFLAKNQYGYVDRMEHTVSPGVEEQQRSAEDIRRRYISAADEETIEIED